MNVSNLWVILMHWHDGVVTQSAVIRGKEKAYRKALALNIHGVVRAEIVTAREADERKMVSDYISEGLGEF